LLPPNGANEPWWGRDFGAEQRRQPIRLNSRTVSPSCNDKADELEGQEGERVMAMNLGDGRRNRPARERALIVAATRLFASRGFEATTTREIAAEAGCAEGLIHRYFGGKEGLLRAIIQFRVSYQTPDLSAKRPSASTVEDEILQIVDFELGRMWEDREFLRVVIPRALLDSSYGQVFVSIVPMQRAKAISERLRRFKECRCLPEAEVESLAHALSIIGFTFGFLRPVIQGHDRESDRKMARTIAQFLAQGIVDQPAGDLLPATEKSLSSGLAEY